MTKKRPVPLTVLITASHFSIGAPQKSQEPDKRLRWAFCSLPSDADLPLLITLNHRDLEINRIFGHRKSSINLAPFFFLGGGEGKLRQAIGQLGVYSLYNKEAEPYGIIRHPVSLVGSCHDAKAVTKGGPWLRGNTEAEDIALRLD